MARPSERKSTAKTLVNQTEAFFDGLPSGFAALLKR